MRRAERSILGQIVQAVLVSTVTMLLLLALLKSQGLMEDVIGRNMKLMLLLKVLVMVLPSLVPYVLPLTAALSIVFVYRRLAGNNELVVLSASGMSNWQLARPGLVAALLGTVVCLAVSVWLMPSSFRQFKDLEDEIKSELSVISIFEGQFNRFSNITVYVRDRRDDGEMLGLLIRDTRDPDKTVYLLGERGRLETTANGFAVKMEQGNEQTYTNATRKLTTVFFDQYEFEIPRDDLIGPTRDRGVGIAERPLLELLNPTPADRADGRTATKMLTEGHKRLAEPFLCVAFTLVGLVGLMGAGYGRRGIAMRLVGIVAVIGALQVVHLTLASGANAGTLPLAAIELVPFGGTLVFGALLLVLDRRGPGGLFGWRLGARLRPRHA